MSFTGLLFYKAIAGFYQCLNLSHFLTSFAKTLLTDYKLLVNFLSMPYIFLTSFVKSFYN
jgi:hypothetical protein